MLQYMGQALILQPYEFKHLAYETKPGELYDISRTHVQQGVTNHWTGLLDWNTGLDYWTHTFLVFTHSEVMFVMEVICFHY